MKPSLKAAMTVGVAAAFLTTAACGSSSTPAASSSSASSSKSSSSSSSSASSSAPADKDYSSLLIAAADIGSGDEFTAQAPTVNPNGAPGVATVFSNQGDTREIGDTILVLPDADGAATALKGASSALSSSVVGGTPAPAQVGSDSVLVSGKSPDGTKAVTVLLFTQGKAFTTLEFDSAPDDPVPADAVVQIGGKQADKIKAELGG